MTTTPYKTTYKSIADLENYVGQEVGLSNWHTIDQATINTFGKLTKDEQWIHIDAVKSAKYSPYKQTIAHGFLVLSLATPLAEECVELEGIKMGVNYGFDKIRFTNPVIANSRIRGRMHLISIDEKDNGCKCKYNLQIEIEGETKPALVAEWLTLVYV